MLYTPRLSQRAVLSSPARFKIVNAGRRWGKSLTALNWILKRSWEIPGDHWWVAPVYRQAKMPWRRLLKVIPRDAIKDLSKTELRAELISGGVVQFFSAENYDALRGEGVVSLVMDEAARIARAAWEETLRPALSDTGGLTFFISTPKARNWFFELWTRGQDQVAWPEYKSWTFPTADNPKVPGQDIQQARDTLPIDVFRQEYLAEFLEGHAGVFRKIEQCIEGDLEPYRAGQIYYMGVDLAKHRDFTVITILDEQGHLVYWDRFNLIDWTFQKQKIYHKAIEYQAIVMIDATGIGDPILDDLMKMGLNVQGFKFTHDSKRALIEALVVGMENRNVTFPDLPVMINELRTFEYQISKSGILTYNAPIGYHDDCVVSLALANWCKQTAVIAWEAPYQAEYGREGAYPGGRRDLSGYAITPREPGLGDVEPREF